MWLPAGQTQAEAAVGGWSGRTGGERGWLGHVELSLAALKPLREEDGAGFESRH